MYINSGKRLQQYYENFARILRNLEKILNSCEKTLKKNKILKEMIGNFRVGTFNDISKKQ